MLEESFLFSLQTNQVNKLLFNRIHLIINPAAGQPQPILNTINKVFQPGDFAWDVSITLKDGDGKRFAQKAIQNGADLIVAYGGDGTVKDVVNGMLDSEVPLAILHGGTGNAMAHHLKIPNDLESALNLIITQHHRQPIDLGKITCESNANEGHFILRSSIGLQNQLLDKASRDLKDRFGVFAYVIAAMQTIAEPETYEYKVTVDGETFTHTGLTCIIANATTIGGNNPFDFAPGVSPGDGLLDVFVLDKSYGSLIEAMRSKLSANLDDFPGHWAGQHIKVEVDPAQEISIDGEKLGRTPITAQVIPNAVQVIVPIEKGE